jgi:spoIIIJ-associated protein
MSSTDSIETTASTIDQAISQALAQLGADQEDVTIEVLATPRSGVLGLGARQARVRVTKRMRESARSGVMSPPPAPPLRPTPPEMRRTEARPEVRREPPRPERSEISRTERPAPSRDERGEPPRGERSDFARNDRRERDERSDAPRDERRDSPRDERGARPADVRSDAPREPRRDNPPRRDGGRGGNDERTQSNGAPGGPQRDNRRDSGRNAPRPNPQQGRGNAPTQEGPTGNGEAPREDGQVAEAPRPRREGRSRGGRGRGGRGRDQSENAQPREAQPSRERDGERRDPERRDVERPVREHDDERDPFASVDEAGNDPRKIADLQEQASEARVFLERLLELMGEKATIEQAESDDPETLELNIKGDGSGILIGRHGQTLDAIEYMVNRLLARKIKDAAPISIDTESYRARRRRLLQRMALSKGEQAKREHVAVSLDPMPPRDRRIVHLALKDDPMITTRSAGDGFMRAIEILPVDERRNPSERGDENRGRGRGRERDRDYDQAPPLGEQGGFKHGQKRIV